MQKLLVDAEPILLFEANSHRELSASLGALREVVPEVYRFARIARDERLAPLEQAIGTTNNYFAIPSWAAGRFGAVMNGLD
jgi:hypothetical protein